MRSMPLIGIACSLIASACVREAQGTSSKKREPAGYTVASDRAARTAEASGRAASVAVGPLDCDGAKRRGLPLFELARLENAGLGSMELVPVQTAGSSLTLSGWRMEIASRQGTGAIFAVELPSGTCYVGHGLFSDWPRAHLEQAYRRFAPREKPVDLDVGQLD